MPYKKGYKKRRGRRTNRRGGGYKGRKYKAVRYVNAGVGIPDRTMVTMKYAQDVTISVGGALGSNYIFRCNSIYDPNQSSVLGGQPLSHDQWQVFYQKYVVVGAKITCRFIADESNTATNSSLDTTNIGITTIKDTSDTITNPTEFMENNRTTYGVICPQKPIHTITKKFSAKKFFGLKNIIDEYDCGAAFGANPVNQAFWQLKLWPVDGSSTTRIVNVNVMIQYICVLRERNNVGAS